MISEIDPERFDGKKTECEKCKMLLEINMVHKKLYSISSVYFTHSSAACWVILNYTEELHDGVCFTTNPTLLLALFI